WGQDDFTIPPELETHPLRDEFIKTVRLLFSTYVDSLEPVKNLIVSRVMRKENESDEAFDRRIRSQYVDRCRFLLPAAANANVGMTANARVIENTIRKMLSHPLEEVRQIGEKVKEVSKVETPNLVKYDDANPYMIETMQELDHWELANRNQESNWCSLIEYDKEGENKVLAAALYHFGEMSYEDALSYIKSSNEREALAQTLLGRLDKFDVPLRELEYCNYTFDLVMDQGAYAEFKRHRMMSQTPQRLTTRLGYTTPSLIAEAGFMSQY